MAKRKRGPRLNSANQVEDPAIEKIKEMVRDRNEALVSLNEEKLRAYAAKYEVKLSEDPEIFWAAAHKARLSLVQLSDAERQRSRDWLSEHGFTSEAL